MMILLIVLVTAWTVSGEQTKCHGIHFREGELYEPEILKEGITNVRGLTYSARKHQLYFTFSYSRDEIESRTAVYNLEDRKTKVIYEINNTITNLADDLNDVIYVAANDGIYKIWNGKITHTAVKEKVLSLSIARNDLYYVNSKHEVFGIRNDKIEQLKMFKTANIIKLVVNSFGDVVFINTLHQVGTLKNAELEFRTHQLLATTLTIDQDNIYVCGEDGLYEYSVTGDSFNKIANLPNLQGLIFTKENTPIYASTGMLVQLNPKICQ